MLCFENFEKRLFKSLRNVSKRWMSWASGHFAARWAQPLAQRNARRSVLIRPSLRSLIGMMLLSWMWAYHCSKSRLARLFAPSHTLVLESIPKCLSVQAPYELRSLNFLSSSETPEATSEGLIVPPLLPLRAESLSSSSLTSWANVASSFHRSCSRSLWSVSLLSCGAIPIS
jgi:hypothetical protein